MALTLDPDSAEPLVSVGTIVAGATAVVDLVVAFGIRVSPDQRTAIFAVVQFAALAAFLAFGRQRVYSPATVARIRAARGDGG